MNSHWPRLSVCCESEENRGALRLGMNFARCHKVRKARGEEEQCKKGGKLPELPSCHNTGQQNLRNLSKWKTHPGGLLWWLLNSLRIRIIFSFFCLSSTTIISWQQIGFIHYNFIHQLYLNPDKIINLNLNFLTRASNVHWRLVHSYIVRGHV